MYIDKLHEETRCFKYFLNVRTHIRKYQDAERKIPAKAGLGTLFEFRSAFNYFVWVHRDSVPYEWNQCLKPYLQGLKNGE